MFSKNAALEKQHSYDVDTDLTLTNITVTNLLVDQNPETQTLNPEPYTLSPTPCTLIPLLSDPPPLSFRFSVSAGCGKTVDGQVGASGDGDGGLSAANDAGEGCVDAVCDFFSEFSLVSFSLVCLV